MPLIPLHHLSDRAAHALGARLAVIPFGAVEAHGDHLPLGTDTLIAEALVARLGAALATHPRPMLALPAVWLGASTEHHATPGTLSLDPAQQLVDQVCALGAGLAALGVDRLVLLNAHGGNQAALELAALMVRRRHGMLAAACHWAHFGLPETMALPAPARGDIHGGWVETSLMLALHPALVDLAQAEDAPARPPAPLLLPEGPVRWGWMTGDVSGARHIGRPRLARADLGQALLDHILDGLCTLVDQLLEAAWPPQPPPPAASPPAAATPPPPAAAVAAAETQP